MLVDRANVSAKLPHYFSRMDIKDLLESDSNRRKHERRPPILYDKVPSPHQPQPVHPPPNFSLPGSGSHPILPSPAPTVLSHADSYFRRQSTPYTVKYEPHDSHHPYPYPAHPAAFGYDFHGYPHPPPNYSPNKRSSSLEEHTSKRQKKGKGPNQKWDAEEDARIIELRGSGMKWGEISKELPGRTEIACRLHYQNYLEKRGQWDEESKTKLARVYDRMKAEIWQPVASELGVPWRSCEAMHWIMGDKDMARRANTTPFTLVAGANAAGPQGEGNGRIAQANRMQENTLYFEDNDLAVLQSPSSAKPTSAGADAAADERSADKGREDEGEQGRASRTSSSGAALTIPPVNGSGHGHALQHPPHAQSGTAEGTAYSDISSPSPTTSVKPTAQRRSSQDTGSGTGLQEDGWRLPGVNALDTGVPAFPPHQQHPSTQSYYQQQTFPPTQQHTLPSPQQAQVQAGHTQLSPPRTDANSNSISHSIPSHSAHSSASHSASSDDDGSERLRALATASEGRRRVTPPPSTTSANPGSPQETAGGKKRASNVTAGEGHPGGEEGYVMTRKKRSRSGVRKGTEDDLKMEVGDG